MIPCKNSAPAVEIYIQKDYIALFQFYSSIYEQKGKTMKKWSVLSCLAVFSCTFALSAVPRQLMVNTDQVSSWEGNMVKAAPEHARKGKGPCFILYGKYPRILSYKNLIKVSADQKYILRAHLRSLNEKLPASAYLGLNAYDKQKRRIQYANVQPIPNFNTASVLVSAKKGDKFLIIKSFSNYPKVKTHYKVAFHAQKDFSDIPNFDLSPTAKGFKLEKNGDLRIEFSKALEKDYAPGTPVRLHSHYSPGMYYLAPGWVKAGGEERIVHLSGISTKAGVTWSRNRNYKFWKGTCYIRPFIWFGNWNRIPKKDAKLLVDGFSFEVESPDAAGPGSK